MLRYTVLGSKILLGLFLFLAAAAAYLPFLEAFALTPAIAFIHRFSITINIGSDTKTLQPIIFVIPILLLKGLWEYHKKHGIVSLLKSKLAMLVALLVIVDVISIFTSTAKTSSISGFIAHGMNLAIFITSSIWLKLVSEMLDTATLQKVAIKLIKTFAIALIGFTVANTVVSVTQFADCSFSSKGCHVWNEIDKIFPNKLLVVGHQKFSKKPTVIRAPGFFGDVNFNGMFSLFIVVCSAVMWLVAELLKNAKGYLPTKEQRFLLIPIIAGMISFLLNLSRSGILGAGILGIVLSLVILLPLIKSAEISKEFWKKLGLFAIAFIGGFALLLALGYAVPLTYKNRQTSLSKEFISYATQMFNPQENSAQGHATLFMNAVTIGNQRPLFGMGLGSFGVQFEKIIAPGGWTNASPHSTYGLVYAEQGLAGITLYLIVIGYLWYIAIRSSRKLVLQLLKARKDNTKLSREFYLVYGSKLLLVLVVFGVPFFSVATISYYGFFLPMTWWWGNGELLNQ